MKFNTIILLIYSTLLFNSIKNQKVFKPNKLAKETSIDYQGQILAKSLRFSVKKPIVSNRYPRTVDALVVKAIYSGIVHSISKALEITGKRFPKNLPHKNFKSKKILRLAFEQIAKEVTRSVQKPTHENCTLFILMCNARNKRRKRSGKRKPKHPQNPVHKHLSKTTNKLFAFSKIKRGNALQILRSQMKETYGQIGFSINWLLFNTWAKSGDLNIRQISVLREFIMKQDTKRNRIIIRNAGVKAFDRVIGVTDLKALKRFGCRVVKRAEKESKKNGTKKTKEVKNNFGYLKDVKIAKPVNGRKRGKRRRSPKNKTKNSSYRRSSSEYQSYQSKKSIYEKPSYSSYNSYQQAAPSYSSYGTYQRY